jgi:hypothetical protein
MPTIVQTFQGKVTGLWGTATRRGVDGKMHMLQLGDIVHKGDVILTSQNGIVQLTNDDSAPVHTAAKAPPADQPDIDRVIADLNDPNSRAATAAASRRGRWRRQNSRSFCPCPSRPTRRRSMPPKKVRPSTSA